MKKLLSALLTIVMFFAVLFAIILFGIRSSFGTNSIGKMLDTMIEEQEIFGDILEEDEDLEELFENKKVKKMMSEVVSGYVKYTLGISDDKPEVEELFEYMADETDVDFDEDEIDEIIEEFESDMEYEREANNIEELSMIRAIFSPALLLITIAIAAGCAFIIYLLSKDVKKAVKRVGIITIINGAIVLILSLIILSVAQNSLVDEEATLAIAEQIINTFRTLSIYSIILGIILTIVAVKVLKNNAYIAESNQSIQNLGNSNNNMFKQ
jgi:hypothetical protein